MKKVLALSFMMVMLFNANLHAGKGFFASLFCCCCGNGNIVETDDIKESLIVPTLSKPLSLESVPTAPPIPRKPLIEEPIPSGSLPGTPRKSLIVETISTVSPIPSDVTVSKFNDFKTYYTADSECRMHIPVSCLFTIRESVTAGRGSKGVVFERKNGEEGKGVYLTYGSGSRKEKIILRQGSVVHNDGFCGMIYHDDGRDPISRETDPDIFSL
jgi:hypothetical protein